MNINAITATPEAQLITKNNVSAAIQEAIDKRRNRVEITQDRVLQELAAIAFAKGTDYASIISGVVMTKDGSKYA